MKKSSKPDNIRNNFPPKGSEYRGGMSDGWCYRTSICSSDPEVDLVPTIRKFLDDEGYSSVPLPPNAERLWRDYLLADAKAGSARNYVWHPVIISQCSYYENGVDIFIFNEKYPDHQAMWDGTFIPPEDDTSICIVFEEEFNKGEQISLKFDVDNFPQLLKRYTAKEVKNILISMCEKLKLPLTEEYLYSCAANFESDLEHMFP